MRSKKGLADPTRRRQLLGSLFEKLYVDKGRVTKYVGRREYREEVEALLQLSVGDGLEYDVPLTGPRVEPERRRPAACSSCI